MSDKISVIRGGGWCDSAGACRSATRDGSFPSDEDGSGGGGFRVVKETKPSVTAGNFRVIRGGSWDNTAEDCRSANREWDDRSGRYDDNGFRVVKETEPKFRVIRGGSWGNTAAGCRSADRGRLTPSGRYISLGFRVVKGLQT